MPPTPRRSFAPLAVAARRRLQVSLVMGCWGGLCSGGPHGSWMCPCWGQLALNDHGKTSWGAILFGLFRSSSPSCQPMHAQLHRLRSFVCRVPLEGTHSYPFLRHPSRPGLHGCLALGSNLPWILNWLATVAALAPTLVCGGCTRSPSCSRARRCGGSGWCSASQPGSLACKNATTSLASPSAMSGSSIARRWPRTSSSTP